MTLIRSKWMADVHYTRIYAPNDFPTPGDADSIEELEPFVEVSLWSGISSVAEREGPAEFR